MGDAGHSWEGFDAAAIQTLRAAGTRRRFPSGATLLNEGDVAGRVLIVEKGRVKVSCLSPEGRETLLAVRGPGQLLGELSVIDGRPVSASASALEEVEVTSVPASAFQDLLRTDSELALQLIRSLTERLRDADIKRGEFGSIDAVTRIARRLVEMAERFGDASGEGVRIALPLSQEEIAGWTGSSRESVSKALQSLRARRLIETQRKEITILDLEGLRRRSL